MKFATLRNGSRDGALHVVSRDLATACLAVDVVPTLQSALDDWSNAATALGEIYMRLNAGTAENAFPFDQSNAMSPLPRAYQWVGGSVFRSHGALMLQALNAANAVGASNDEPLLYQGGSDDFIGPYDDIIAVDESWGFDFEGEIAVIVDDVRIGTPADRAEASIKLLMLVNDISLRNLIGPELAKGFGFLQSKPASSFSPVAVTPDELGAAWHHGMVHLPLLHYLNDTEFGRPNAGVDASFNFPQLIAHAAKTRNLVAGSIISSGTVSNADPAVGWASIAARRGVEKVRDGAPRTPFLRPGDRIRIEMLNDAGHSIFGAIEQRVKPFQGSS